MTASDLRTDEMTSYEVAAVDRYETETAALVDCLDLLYDDAPTLGELHAPGGWVRDWWTALDSLDAALADGRLSTAFARYLANEMDLWFGKRQKLYEALAKAMGVELPRPDHGDDGVATSNRVVGHYGFQFDYYFD